MQVFYFYVRIRYTFPSHYIGYSAFIFVFEVIGSSNTVLQGLYLLRRKEYHYGQSPPDLLHLCLTRCGARGLVHLSAYSGRF